LKNAIHIGHSTGGGEVARYIGRHGTERVSSAVLVGAVPPLMAKSDTNPEGLPIAVFDQIRAAVLADRSQFYKDLSQTFYGANRPGAKVSQGTHDAFWRMSMQCGVAAAYQCVKAFSETDFREDLKKVDVPTLVIHGDDDQVVPINVGGNRSAKMIKDATLKVYAGAPHGLMNTHRERFNTDLLAFARDGAARTPRPGRRGGTEAPAARVAHNA
jgi:non-heme chloroperoxidase